jgi:pimeloyl-ACP methyl ester carboxylesterase
MKRAYASLGHGQVHYAEAGAGAPLLLLHSAPRSSRAYRFLMPKLAPHFRCLAPDLPGFGQSDPLSGKVSMEALGGAMADFLGALGIARAHVFGYHTGNKVAAAMAADHPQRVDRVVLCGQIHSIIPDRDARNDAIHHIVGKYFAEFPSSPSGEHLLRRWQADWSDITAFAQPRSLFSKKNITEADIADLKVRVLDHVQAVSAITATYGANFDYDFGGALGRIAASTLMLELVMPDEEHLGRQLDAACKLLAKGRGETLHNAGRVAIESHAEEIAHSLTTFLNEGP